ncbi:RNA polymerase sigma factor [Pseudocolwellia sp. HL-MZ19]|uniref:RNA polymerase sigma factor n=1 Tax=Pseudocolwellia sp. HL-MZ19 TaxID=3400846 RepID=UPI003CF65667
MNLQSKIKGWLSTAQVSLSHVTSNASPEEVMAQYIATGKKHYLTLLVEAFNGSLYHYLLSQSDKATAEDVVQTVWLKVMNSQSQMTPTHIKSWLFTIARHTLIDELRKQNKWQHIEFDDQLSHSHNLEQAIEKDTQINLFNQALLDLPFLQREAFHFSTRGLFVNANSRADSRIPRNY